MKNYFAPEVEVLDVMVEKGFSISTTPGGGIFGADEEEID